MKKLCNADYGSCDFSCENKIGRCKVICNIPKPQKKHKPTKKKIRGKNIKNPVSYTGRDYSQKKCSNPKCTYTDRLTFHHYWPKSFRIFRIGLRSKKNQPISERQQGIMLCHACHKAVHRARTNKELVDQGYTTKEKIIELLKHIT